MQRKSTISNDLYQIGLSFYRRRAAGHAVWAKKLSATKIDLQNLKFSAANVTMFVHSSILRRIAFKICALD